MIVGGIIGFILGFFIGLVYAKLNWTHIRDKFHGDEWLDIEEEDD